MISFESAPAVPATYERLRAALTPNELDEAIRCGYVTREPNPDFRPAGTASFGKSFVVPSEHSNWRNRMLLVWFCFVFENMRELRNPLSGLEEILFELQGGPADLDVNLVPLSTVYAGAAAREPLSPRELDKEMSFLKPYYSNALKALASLRKKQGGSEESGFSNRG